MPTGPITSPGPVRLRMFCNDVICSLNIRCVFSLASMIACWRSSAFTILESALGMIVTPNLWNPVSASLRGTTWRVNSSDPRCTSSSTGVCAGRRWMKSTVVSVLCPGADRSRSPMRSTTSSRKSRVRSTASAGTSLMRTPGKGSVLDKPMLKDAAQRVLQAVMMFATTPPARTQSRSTAGSASNSFRRVPSGSCTFFSSLKRT
mmetsp:Transcript_65988/g.157791  ORF Transcript_65988/g.157791 Transcript_65988/m.157791 type:complete len:204 (+) Transcript_65988:1601-2212(+)